MKERDKIKTLITGAGRGIGKSIAEVFAKEGSDLYLIIRKPKQYKDLKHLEKKYKVKVQIFIGDLKSKKFLKNIGIKIPYVNNLINNAALANTKFYKVKRDEIDDLFDVNLKAIFLLSKIFSKKMISKKIKANIISISSQLGHIGAYNRSLYCMTKFGLEGLNKALSLDLGKYGIRTVTVSPTKTIVDENEYKKTPKRLKLIKNKTALKKFSTKEQIASIVYFLTKKESSAITGSSVIVDGGWTAGK